MGVKGKHSAADLAVVRGAMARIAPPDDLTPAQVVEWNGITGSLPPDWFRPADVFLLRAFVIAAALHRQATQEIAEMGITLVNDRGTRCMNPAVSVMTTAAAGMAQMASKLRLCPSSRVVTSKAQSVSERAPQSRKPWDLTQSG